LFEANKKTAVVAYLLWFFLGLFGGHNFYLKRTGVAVAQLILTLTVVGMLITIVMGVRRCVLDSRLGTKPKQSFGCAAGRVAGARSSSLRRSRTLQLSEVQSPQ
jgi:TM2 domain-containing membrane protein YozV